MQGYFLSKTELKWSCEIHFSSRGLGKTVNRKTLPRTQCPGRVYTVPTGSEIQISSRHHLPMHSEPQRSSVLAPRRQQQAICAGHTRVTHRVPTKTRGKTACFIKFSQLWHEGSLNNNCPRSHGAGPCVSSAVDTAMISAWCYNIFLAANDYLRETHPNIKPHNIFARDRVS